jgi:hypothetical protein
MVFRSRIGAMAYINYVRVLEKTELYQPTYQKRDFLLLKKERFKRSSDIRVQAISANMPKKQGSYLDIGSQLGYFVFKMSELGHLSLGIEMHKVSYDYAMNLKNINGVENAHFLNLQFDREVSERLPAFDAISILSVFHHLVYFQGYENAIAIIRNIAAQCGSRFFFETGEFEEKGFYWTEGLRFMGSNSKKWILDFLKSLKFKKVEIIATTETHLTEHNRTLFCCSR